MVNRAPSKRQVRVAKPVRSAARIKTA